MLFTLSQCEVEEAQEDDEEEDAEPHDIPVSLLHNETENHKPILLQTHAHTTGVLTRASINLISIRGRIFQNTYPYFSALTLGHHYHIKSEHKGFLCCQKALKITTDAVKSSSLNKTSNLNIL